MAIKVIGVTELRRDAGGILRAVREEGDVVYVTQRGRPAVVVVDYEAYVALLAQLEDLCDLVAMEAVAGEQARAYEAFVSEMELSGRSGG